jgi:hypothetical protein
MSTLGSTLSNQTFPTVSGIILTGSGVSRPAAGTAGRLYKPTDGYYDSYDNGSSWDTYVGGFKCSNPPAADTFTAINGGAPTTLVVDGDSLLMTQMGTANGAQLSYAFVQAVPAAPYQLVVGIDLQCLWGDNYSGLGICLTNGTSNPNWITFDFTIVSNAFNIEIVKFTSTNTYSAHYRPAMGFPRSPVYFLRFRDDSTTRYAEYSLDGRLWKLIYSVGRTDFITPTYCGICAFQSNTNVATVVTRSQAKIVHWSLG